ncbi:unnamed protein product [Lactuca virosa]|uniref:MI domain-containing protein n=1 Tax=Lactuca virosa TaxID=75947 RepID=A0AAU9P5Q6_9ASTR|nr:unnamed protein product [Lactuca virosa]
MGNESGNKSRKERRKEARLDKSKKKFDSWVQHHQLQKTKKSSNNQKAENVQKNTQNTEEKETSAPNDLNECKDVKRKKNFQEKSKTKFEEYIDMETQKDDISAVEDVKLERKLAKKLKVKDKKLHGVDDDINMLFEGIPSALESLDTESGDFSKKTTTSLKKKKRGVSSKDDQINTSLETKVLRKKKTTFEKYLEMDKQDDVASAKEDIALERKLAKKLKVKKGKLGGDDDDINMLFDGISSVFDSLESEENTNTDMEEEEEEEEEAYEATIKKNISRKKRKKNSEQKVDVEIRSEDVVQESEHEHEHDDAQASKKEGHAKYVPPQLRSMSKNELEEHAQIRKRVRGLLNRLSESNVEGITMEMSSIFHSIARGVGAQIISEEILASCAGGPRGNEQYASVFSALVAGLACLVGIDFGAKLLASLAKCFEDEYLKEDNLSLRNLTLLLSYLYIFGVCSSDLIYDFMMMLSSRLTEVDVSTILTVLNCCGMRLRSDDPATMKNFIVSIQNKVAELKATSDNQAKSKRMEFMLETIFDIKNNKKRAKEDTLPHTRIKKWLQKLRVESILVRGLKWSKLIDPNKKGQWWLSGDMISSSNNNDNIGNVAKKIDKETSEAQKMLQLAAKQRMNTDARRAIFCIIMSSEDYIDAFQKLLRLDLQGKQDREMMRVLVECCLQEKIFNKYYCVLASQLCTHDKNHKFTLQYCVWDHYGELESMQLMRSMHLAKFIAEMVSNFTLSLAVLKKADLHDTTQLSCKKKYAF